jgi:DNA repair exonuclease SbcCD nuclease subunit
MKIAITADVHLAADRPERLESFSALCGEWSAAGLPHVIVAGDLFDAGMTGYKEVDALGARHPEMTFHIIRGNHDITITQAIFASRNLRVYSEPAFETFGSRTMLFLPYEETGSASRLIARHALAPRIERNRTCLVMHGDVAGSGLEESGREGAYFPIAISDRSTYGFARVFLGHIHRPHDLDGGRFVYPGSPCPLDPTERGARRWLLYDVDRDTIESKPIHRGPVYDELVIRVLPDGREIEQVREETAALLAGAILAVSPAPGKGAGAPDGVSLPGIQTAKRLRVRVRLVGASATPIGVVAAACEDVIVSAGATLDQDPDTTRLEIASQSPLLEEIARRAIAQLETEYVSWSGTPHLPSRDEIAEAVLRTLYVDLSRRRRA